MLLRFCWAHISASACSCLHYIYVDLSSYSEARGENGYISIGGRQERIQLFPEISINRELGTTNMAVLDSRQVSVTMPCCLSW